MASVDTTVTINLDNDAREAFEALTEKLDELIRAVGVLTEAMKAK